jgi:predicted permease
MLQDLRLAARLLWKSPFFTAGVVALLAFVVAANTAIFSLVDVLLLRHLPVPEPDRLVRFITIREPLGVRGYFSFAEYETWKTRLSGIHDLFAWAEEDFYATVGERAERVRVHFVTDRFFESLGATAHLGRVLRQDDQQAAAGTAPVVLSQSYWARRFHRDPGVIGRTIALEGHKVVITGVTRQGFNGLAVETSPDIRIPAGWLHSFRPELNQAEVSWEVAGRLKPGTMREAVREEAGTLWRNGWKERNPTDPGVPGRFDLEPAARGISRLRSQFSAVLWLLMGGGVLLMAMVCANVAGLLLARAADRASEIAIRVTLGATRLRIIRQAGCEALLLMSAGCVVALALAAAFLPLLAYGLPPVRDFTAARLALSLDLAPDWRVFGFAIGTSAVTVLLFGLAPAILTARGDVNPLLKTRRSGGNWRGRQVLVSLQVALCTLLLTGAGLTLFTLERLRGLDAGFDHDRVVTFAVDTDMAKYTPEQGVELRERLIANARQLPEVESAAAASRGLMRGTGFKLTIVRAGDAAREADFMNTSGNHVTPDYFAAMRIPLRAGRTFTGREPRMANPRPVVVNEAFARRFSTGGRGVLGARFGSVAVNAGSAKPAFEVIGVVGDTKYRSLREPVHPIMYGPLFEGSFLVHLRTRSRPESVIAPMHRLLAGLDPRLSYNEVTTLESEVTSSLWPERVAAFLTTAFAAAASLIAGAGLYALVALAVTQRRREIALRVALGASARQVVKLMFARSSILGLAGVAGGASCAWILAPRLGPVLYNVSPRDGAALLLAAACALGLTLIAALIPSLRATRVQPASVLREE